MNLSYALRHLVAATVIGLLLSGCDGAGAPSEAAGPTSPVSVTPTPSRTTDAPSAPSSNTPPTTEAPAPTTPPLGSPNLQPLWPFTTFAQAQEWERSYRSGGHQPWHLDPDRTALAFTRDYLGFKEIDRVSSRTVKGRHAHIGVAPTGPEGGTAAVIHLARFGTGPNAPWEVVGTDDTTFSLTNPAYGKLVSSPLVTGGRITGVDETIRIQVRQPSSAAPLGTSPCCIPAGGDNQPWHAKVSFSGARDPVLTVVASTGGHVSEVERFTITAVLTNRSDQSAGQSR